MNLIVLLPTLMSVVFAHQGVGQDCSLVYEGTEDMLKVETRSVKVLQVQFVLPKADQYDLQHIANQSWFRPERWFVTYGSSSERLLLLLNYYYGLLRPLLSVTLGHETVDVKVQPAGCFSGLGEEEAEDNFRRLVLHGLGLSGPGNKSANNEPYLSGFSVCSMHITSRTHTGRITFKCCKATLEGRRFKCRTVENDTAVHVLSGLLIVLTILVFLFFPLFVPRGEEVNSFTYVPKRPREVSVVVTKNPLDYRDVGCNIIHQQLLQKVPGFHEQLTRMEPDTLYKIRIGAIKFSTNMDRLLPEKEAPFGVFKLIYDTFIRCTTWRSGPMRDFCQAPVCGECCCCASTPWQNCVLSVRTLLVLLVLAVPAIPFMYAQSVEDSEHAQIAQIIHARGLIPISNFWFGPVAGKVVVGVLVGFYLLHCLMYLCISCARSSEILTYTDLLRNSTVDVSLKSRLQMLRRMFHRTFLPLKRWGLCILPLWLLLLLLTPALLLLYTIFASPIIKMFVHILKLCKKKWYIPRTGEVNLKSFTKHFFTLIFLFTLVIVFIVIAIGFNFLLHVICLIIINFIINLDAALKIFPVVILFVVYTRDILKRLVDRYMEFHQIIISQVISLDDDVIRRVASQSLMKQENTAFVIKNPEVLSPPAEPVSSRETTPSSADVESVDIDATPPVQPEVADLTPFLVRYGSPRVRMRSLVLFLDKQDIPYIPQKFFYAMTQMTCPGSPGDLPEALTQAFIDLSRIVVFLLLLLVLILAYGDVQYISSGVQFIATVAAGLIPLILRYFFFNQETSLQLDKDNLRFQTQFAEIINSFTQTWDLQDLAIDEVKNEGFINPVNSVKVAHEVKEESPQEGRGQTDKADAVNAARRLEAVDADTGNTVFIRAADVIEMQEVTSARGVVADAKEAGDPPKEHPTDVTDGFISSTNQSNAKLMTVRGLFKVDGVLMQLLKEFSPFGDEPVASEDSVRARDCNDLQIDLLVDSSVAESVSLPREENKFHYLVRRKFGALEENIAMV